MRLLEPGASESERSLIAAQPDRGSEKARSDYQPNPQTRAAQESPRSELCQRNKMRIDRDAGLVLEVESVRSESNQSVPQHGAQILSVKRNVLKGGNRRWWEHRPQKCRPPRVAGDQKKPAIQRRVPQHKHDHAVEEHQLHLE